MEDSRALSARQSRDDKGMQSAAIFFCASIRSGGAQFKEIAGV